MIAGVDAQDKEPITDEERGKRFEEEVKKRVRDGDFGQGAETDALERMVKNAGGTRTTKPSGNSTR